MKGASARSTDAWPLAAREAGIFGHSSNGWRVVIAEEGRESAAAEALLLELRSLIDEPIQHVPVHSAERLVEAIESSPGGALVLSAQARFYAQDWRTIDLRRSRLMRTGPTLLIVTSSDVATMVSSAPNLWSWIGGEVWRLCIDEEQQDA